MGKATNFKFGQNIYSVHPSKSPLKILKKRERGHIHGLPKFFGYPLLSQEREKLRISNLVSTFRRSIRIKAHEKVWRKGSVGVPMDCPNFFRYPLLSQELEKLRIWFQIWPVHLGPSEQKPIKNFRENRAWAYPRTAHFFGYPLLSRERVKLRTSNFACTFIGSIGTKGH